MGGVASKDYKIVEVVDLSGLAANSGNGCGKCLSWSLSKAVLSNHEGASEFSVFDYGDSYSQFRNAEKILQSIRHPNIISLKNYPKHAPEGQRLVVDPVEPLSKVLHDLDLQEISSGLYDIIKALNFLHSSAGISHNSVGLHSTFVSRDGAWKLGCFEAAGRLVFPGNFSEDHKDFLLFVRVLIDLLEGCRDATLNFLVDFHGRLEASLASAGILDFDGCLSDRLFQSNFLRIRTFLLGIVVKNADEKTAFFRTLTPNLCDLQEDLVARRLVTLLLQRFVLLDESARKYFLPSFLTPRGGSQRASPGITPILGEDLFKSHVCPVLMRVFTVHDASIRVALLQNFSNFFRSFSRLQLQDTILNQLLLSARDRNDLLVELSLRALADLVSVLGSDLIIRSQSHHYFFDGRVKELDTRRPLDGVVMATSDAPTTELSETKFQDGLHEVETPSCRSLCEVEGSGKTTTCAREDHWVQWSAKKSEASEGVQRHEEEQSALLQPASKDDNSTSEGSWRLEEDLVRSKSLESLNKSRSLRAAKPIAVIEPKTIYQLAVSDVRSRGDFPDAEKCGGGRPDTGGGSDLVEVPRVPPAVEVEAESQKSVGRGRCLQTDQKDGGDAVRKPSCTLLLISQGALAPDSSSKSAKEIASKESGASREEGSESDWDEKWEDFDAPVAGRDEGPRPHPTPRPPAILSISKPHAAQVSVTDLQKGYSIRPQLPSASSSSRHRPKLSDTPLGFGYDVKQVEIKTKVAPNEEEDEEWKLFADLMNPSRSRSFEVEGQKGRPELGKVSINGGDVAPPVTSESSTVTNSGWETNDLDLDLE